MALGGRVWGHITHGKLLASAARNSLRNPMSRSAQATRLAITSRALADDDIVKVLASTDHCN